MKPIDMTEREIESAIRRATFHLQDQSKEKVDELVMAGLESPSWVHHPSKACSQVHLIVAGRAVPIGPLDPMDGKSRPSVVRKSTKLTQSSCDGTPSAAGNSPSSSLSSPQKLGLRIGAGVTGKLGLSSSVGKSVSFMLCLLEPGLDTCSIPEPYP